MTEEQSHPVRKSRPGPTGSMCGSRRRSTGTSASRPGIANLKPAALLRELSLGSCLTAGPPLPKDVYRAIRSFGGNLNQLAHQANMGHGNPKQVEALRASVDDLLKALLAG